MIFSWLIIVYLIIGIVAGYGFSNAISKVAKSRMRAAEMTSFFVLLWLPILVFCLIVEMLGTADEEGN